MKTKINRSYIINNINHVNVVYKLQQYKNVLSSFFSEDEIKSISRLQILCYKWTISGIPNIVKITTADLALLERLSILLSGNAIIKSVSVSG